ncbi:5969_t:CDS:2 [Gigaspora rosea]|nr:5969_t:CDS:2 [Gigaspora rosea]
MSIVYEPSSVVDPLKSILPLRRTLKTNKPILITSVTKNSSPSLLKQLHKIFNEIIEEGTTYPQEFFLDYDGFINLFLSHNTFINDTIKVKKASEKNKFPSTKTGLKKIKEKIRKDNLRKRLEKVNSYNEDSLQDAEEIKRVNLERNLKYFTFNPKEIDKELDE